MFILVIHAKVGMRAASHKVQQYVPMLVVPRISQRPGFPLIQYEGAGVTPVVVKNHVPGEPDNNELVLAYGLYRIILVIGECCGGVDFPGIDVVADRKEGKFE